MASKPQPTDQMPTPFMVDILRRMPFGMTAKTLLTVMVEAGFKEEEASSVIRRELDRGVIRLGRHMQLEVATNMRPDDA